MEPAFGVIVVLEQDAVEVAGKVGRYFLEGEALQRVLGHIDHFRIALGEFMPVG